jgi:hypothetical protein
MTSSINLSKINYKDYPECMFAVIAAYLPVHEGDDLRRAAGKVGFRSEDTIGRTYRNGLLHSYMDQPAAVSDVLHTKFWYKNGKRHREGDLPAVQSATNSEWYKNGKRHREGHLPAVVFKGRNLFSGGEYNEWWVNGVLHREDDLPAIESKNGRCEWWNKGQRHREGDLPALTSSSGYSEWWVNGEFVKSERIVF